MELPIEIVGEILLSLPVKALIKFKCVCKLWSSLISSHQFQKDHYSRTPPQILTIQKQNHTSDDDDDDDDDDGNDPSITLHLSTYSTTQGTLINYFSKTLSWPKRPHPLIRISPTQSCLGLVCIGTKMQSMLLCNPSTQEIISLPPFTECTICIGFGYAASTQEFKFFRFFRYGFSQQHHCGVFSFGIAHWRPARTHPPYCVRWGSAPLVQGSLHLLPVSFDNDYIAAFNIDTEEYTRVPLPQNYSPKGNPQLTELEGLLCLTSDFTSTRRLLEIWLLKDHQNIVWVKGYTIDLSKLLPSSSPGGLFSVLPIGVTDNGCILLNVCDYELWCYDPRDQSLAWKIADNCASTSYVESFFSLGTR